jgi:succinate dehydrogenase/fumarate reductase cytochrome b subunit
MLASERTVYGRTFRVTPVWLWLLQRASGLLLGPLVTLHIWLPSGASIRVLNAVLLTVTVVHGYSGVRRAISDPGCGRQIVIAAFCWAIIVTAFGTLLVVGGRPAP